MTDKQRTITYEEMKDRALRLSHVLDTALHLNPTADNSLALFFVGVTMCKGHGFDKEPLADLLEGIFTEDGSTAEEPATSGVETEAASGDQGTGSDPEAGDTGGSEG